MAGSPNPKAPALFLRSSFYPKPVMPHVRHPVEHARHGYAALDTQVHGNPADAVSNFSSVYSTP